MSQILYVDFFNIKFDAMSLRNLLCHNSVSHVGIRLMVINRRTNSAHFLNLRNQ